MHIAAKRLLSLVLMLVLLAGIVPAAHANSYGLSSQTLLKYVEGNSDWDDYSAACEYRKSGVSVTAAVMRSRYHAVLLVGRLENRNKSHVWQSTTAVFQPGETNKDIYPKLTCTDQTVTMLYPDYDYEFVFTWDNSESDEGSFILTKGRKGGLEVKLDLNNYVYRVNGVFVWQASPVALEDFNVSLFPETAQQFEDMNRVYAALDCDSGFWSAQRSTKSESKLPVYSAPDPKSYRAANGKASVNLKGGVTLMATLDHWDLVEYAVSLRTHRIGWIEGNHLGDPAPISLSDIPVNGAAYLTDDPLCSQYRSFKGSELTDIHLLACLNPFYAYAKAKTAAGTDVWGFVPVSQSLQMPAEKVDTDYMARLTGTWVISSGGCVAAEVLRLREDGSCDLLNLTDEARESMENQLQSLAEDMLDHSADTVSGTWCVIDNIDNSSSCEKTLLISVDRTYNSLGIHYLGEGYSPGSMCLSLVRGEGGGSYTLVTEAR